MALYDIDGQRLQESEAMLQAINTNINAGRAKIKCVISVWRIERGPARRAVCGQRHSGGAGV